MNEITFHYAQFKRRFAACAIDFILIHLIYFGLAALVGTAFASGGISAEGIAVLLGIVTGGFLLSITGLSLVYHSLFESSKLQGTPGKLMLSIRVADLSGGRISLPLAILRNLSKVLSALPICYGFWVAANDPRHQAWHDRIGKTLVLESGNP